MIKPRILGLDIGDRTIGVAVSDPFGWTAQGVTTIKRSDLPKDLEELGKIVEEYKVTKMVVGIPKNMNGTFGPQAEKVRELVKEIVKQITIETVEWDERLSTKMAERSLIEGDMRRNKRKKVIDTVAAVCILQGYLDYQQHHRE
ncbi:Holliday junction resolvase RuvX [Tindallia californiensis]|uniref:Putative pre-16S rRNA nuclease n=1 Tax=Tindallia californiensis TaxID=159292 RepID=A0A1H3NGP0_9FIRM|nr:Holliday junction resolvase RuvX [Tindallia californiensis]SDY88092.1 putative holliday junction resolvase [Tindallia californiensis]